MQKDFCLGSQWLYYKIYTGVKTADYILLEKLAPVIGDLQRKNSIQKWFFIRYKDPDDHIRIRFQINKTEDLAAVIQAFYNVFNRLIEQNLVWKIQTDTYQREIERYGKSTMQESEFLFWKDSEMALLYIEIKSSFDTLEFPLLFTFFAIDSFLNLFRLSNQEKLSLLDSLQLSFKKEFDVEKTQKKEMNKSYRTLYPKIEQFLSPYLKNDLAEIFDIVDEKSQQINKTVLIIRDKIEISLPGFLSGHIHMMLNRQYTSKQRMYELIVYDHLFRYYKTQEYKKLATTKL